MKKYLDIIFNVELLKIVCLFSSIILVIPYFYNYVSYLKLLHIYAFVVIMYDLFNEKRLIKNKGKTFFYVLLICYSVTMILNTELISISHISDLGYFCIQLFLIFSYSYKVTRSYKVFINLYLVSVSVLNGLGVFMFCTQFQSYVNGSYIGMYPHEYRLCGFFGNPAVQSFVSFFAIGMVILSFLNLEKKYRKNKMIIGLYSCLFMLNFYTLTLANARATILSTYVLIALFTLSLIWVKKRRFVYVFLGVTLSIIFNFSFITISNKISTVIIENYNEKVIEEAKRLEETNKKPTSEKKENTNVEKKKPNVVIEREETGLNGRSEIWLNGIHIFTKNPIFGIGLNNFEQKLLEYNNSTLEISGSLHNSFLEYLVSFGAIGAFIMLLFLISFFDNCSRYFTLCKQDSNYNLVVATICFIVSILIIGMADSSIMFSIYPTSIIFFWSLGYLYHMFDIAFQKKGILHQTFLHKLIVREKKQTDICFVIDSLGGGGAEKILVTVANALSEKHTIRIVTLWSEEILESNLNDQIVLESFDHFHLRILKRILYWINRNHLPIYIINTLYIRKCSRYYVAFLEGMPTKLISSLNEEDCIKYAWIHVDLKKQNWVLKYFKNQEDMRCSYMRFDKIFCVSENVKSSFDELFKLENKTFIQLNLVDTRNIIKMSEEVDLSIPEKKKQVLRLFSMGRLNEQKGYDRLIEALARLKKEKYNFELWLLGDGAQRQALVELVNKNNLNDNVKFMGFQINPYKFVKYCDVFICSSRAEGFSTVITENLILGTPIISTDCAGVKEQLGDSEYGVVVENSLEGIYHGIKYFLDDKTLIDTYSKKAKDRGGIFIYSSIKGQYEELFKQAKEVS